MAISWALSLPVTKTLHNPNFRGPSFGSLLPVFQFTTLGILIPTLFFFLNLIRNYESLAFFILSLLFILLMSPHPSVLCLAFMENYSYCFTYLYKLPCPTFLPLNYSRKILILVLSSSPWRAHTCLHVHTWTWLERRSSPVLTGLTLRSWPLPSTEPSVLPRNRFDFPGLFRLPLPWRTNLYIVSRLSSAIFTQLITLLALSLKTDANKRKF